MDERVYRATCSVQRTEAKDDAVVINCLGRAPTAVLSGVTQRSQIDHPAVRPEERVDSGVVSSRTLADDETFGRDGERLAEASSKCSQIGRDKRCRLPCVQPDPCRR